MRSIDEQKRGERSHSGATGLAAATLGPSRRLSSSVMDEETERTLRNIAKDAEIQRKASESGIESARVPEALARQIALARQFTESPTIKSAQRLAEQANTHVAHILGDTPSRLQEIIEQSNRSAGQLRSMLPSEEQLSRATDSLAREHTPLPALIPRPEIEAAYVIQEHLPALVELQAKSLEQTAAVATIAQAQLEIASQQKTSSDALNGLTKALVGLTVVLVVIGAAAIYVGFAGPLDLWPFNLAGATR